MEKVKGDTKKTGVYISGGRQPAARSGASGGRFAEGEAGNTSPKGLWRRAVRMENVGRQQWGIPSEGNYTGRGDIWDGAGDRYTASWWGSPRHAGGVAGARKATRRVAFLAVSEAELRAAGLLFGKGEGYHVG